MIGTQCLRTRSLVVACLMVFILSRTSVVSSDGHDHHDHSIEMGVSVAYVYLDAEDASAPGLHLHLMRRLGGDGFLRHVGIGVGLEGIFADHTHYGVMLSIAIFPWRTLVVTLSPGLAFADHDGEWETEYVSHIEASYGFMVGEYEVGPVVGFADSPGDEHYMVGIHVGKGF